MARPRLEVADVFRAHVAAWRKANAGHVSLGQLKVMSAIETCRTSALGGHVEHCEDCAHERVAYNSCRNRHCPKCQGAAARQWLEEREAELLPVAYYHVVFTLPYYEGATTSRLRIPGRLSVSLPGSARSPAFRARLGGAPGWLEDPAGPGHLVSRPPICRHTLTRTQAGSHRFPGDPSHAFAPVQDPGRTDDPHPDGVVDAAPAQPTAKAPAIEISRLLTRLQHLLPTLHDGRRRTPCKARFRLVG